MLKKLIGAIALASSFSALATNETSFTYGGIYKSLKTAQQAEFSALSLNFYLKETGTTNICPTTRVYLSDGEKTIDLSVTKAGKLLLPLDKKLKKDHAAITLVTEQVVTCHLDMEIAVADFELEQITPQKLKQWNTQFNAMFAKLAGWPGKYFMPDISALRFVLASKQHDDSRYKDGNEQIKLAPRGASEFLMEASQIDALSDLAIFSFGGAVVKVTPVLAK